LCAIFKQRDEEKRSCEEGLIRGVLYSYGSLKPLIRNFTENLPAVAEQLLPN